MSGSNPLAAVLASEGQGSNPLAMAGGVINLAKGAQDVRTSQFNLQQAQLQPGYQAMRMLMLTNPNPSWGDVQTALAQSRRLGANVDGLVANANEIMASNGKPADFMRATALGGMSPEHQGELVGPQMQARPTAQGTYYGTVGGAWSPNANVFQPTGFVGKGLSPSEATTMVQVPELDANGQPTGIYTTKPAGTVYSAGIPGSGPPGAGGGGGGAGFGGGPLLPPGAPADVAAARIDQIGQRESGNQNIPNRQGPRGSPLSSASGPYQFLDSTWQQAAREYGIPNPTPRAMDTDPAIQRAVAIRFLQNHGEQPWATSAPQGRGGGGGGGGPPAAGPFVGATSAQPVTGGPPVQPPVSGGPPVQPASGMQYFPPSPGGYGGGGGQGGGGPSSGGRGGGGVYVGPDGVPRDASGAPSFPQPSPYVLPQWEQSSKDYVAGQVIDKTLGQRIAPLQSAIGLVKDNPDLVTGPSAENWYQWVQGLATATGINVGDVTNADAYQQLVKELGRNLLNNGADPTDMARLMREASQPNPTAQGREALVTLAAEQIGYERMKSMQYREFRSRHPNDANNKSQFFNAETGDFASNLDPKAVAADLIPQAELQSYYRGLNPDAKKRFDQTLVAASRLFKFKIPEQGG